MKLVLRVQSIKQTPQTQYQDCQFSCDHLNIHIIRNSRLRLLLRRSSVLLSPTAPIIFHFTVQLLLRLPRSPSHHSRPTSLPPTPATVPIILSPYRTPPSIDGASAAGAPGSAPPASDRLARHVSVHAFRWRFAGVRPPGCTGASAAVAATVRVLDAIKEAARGFDGRVKGVSGRCGATTANQVMCRGTREESEPDRLPSCVGAIELADCAVGGGDGGVGYVCCACGAACAVKAEGEGSNWGDAGEEVLL